MPSYPIGERPMTPTERSRRKRRLREQRLDGMRQVLLDSAAIFLRLGAEAKAREDMVASSQFFQAAERAVNAANDEPDAPLVVTVDDSTALRERQNLERRDIVRYLESIAPPKQTKQGMRL